MAFDENAYKLAWSYLEELGDSKPVEASPAEIEHARRNHELAYKNIKKIENETPTGNISVEDVKRLKTEYYYQRAVMLALVDQDYSAALDSVNKALAHSPDLASAYKIKSDIYLHKGNKDEAVKNIKKAVELDPDELTYRKTLDNLEDISATSLKLATFRGSRKIIFGLVGFGVFLYGWHLPRVRL